MELGVYSFGDTQRNPDGSLRPTAEAIRNLHEAIVLADQAGLDYFGVGEHHTADMPASSPGAMIAAAAGATKRIRLGSSVSVLSTDDPVRVFQQFAIADAVSGGGRVEITAGRGSSAESYPLFGYERQDYDQLYAEKLDLLMTINNNDDDGARVSWAGAVRPALSDLGVAPPRHRLPLNSTLFHSPPTSPVAPGASKRISPRVLIMTLPVVSVVESRHCVRVWKAT
jgi:alkanesulfonate monooxygenase SsuD/methylene tetrahydromethanopterin reductase-like flavin-dependent oxidoreductase (luciferase family)